MRRDPLPLDDSPEAVALSRTRERVALWTHATVYAVVCTGLVLVWAFGPAQRFWPGFVMAGWGVAVALQAARLHLFSRGSTTWRRIHEDELARARRNAG